MIEIKPPAYPAFLTEQDAVPCSKTQLPASSWVKSLFSDPITGNEALQFDGPPYAYFDLPLGTGSRHVYQTVRWQSADLDKLKARVRAWADSIRANPAEFIVWRMRPDVDFRDGKHRFYCRLVILPERPIPEATDEGDVTPEA